MQSIINKFACSSPCLKLLGFHFWDFHFLFVFVWLISVLQAISISQIKGRDDPAALESSKCWGVTDVSIQVFCISFNPTLSGISRHLRCSTIVFHTFFFGSRQFTVHCMVFPTSYCTSAPGYSLQTTQYTAVIVFHIVHFFLDLDSLQCTAYISDQLQCTGTSIFITQYAIHCCHSFPLCAIQLHPPWYFALIGRLCRVYLILDNSSFQQFAGAKVHCIFSK